MGFLLGDAIGTIVGKMEGTVLGSFVGTNVEGPVVIDVVGRKDG